jgi:RNA polymerase sigma-70 factor, ECF subfamily
VRQGLRRAAGGIGAGVPVGPSQTGAPHQGGYSGKGEWMAQGAGGEDAERARRFRDAALPHLDDVYTLARYLLRNATDAEDAAQECYLRAFRHFDGFRGGPIKPWLMAILRNVCRAEFARRSGPSAAEVTADLPDNVVPLWQESDGSPETELIRERNAQAIQSLLAELPGPFREAIVMRDINDLSYREIAEAADVPVGTVMSRLARARSMLRAAWRKSESEPRLEGRSK